MAISDKYTDAILNAAAAGDQYDIDPEQKRRKLNPKPDAFIIELAVQTQMPRTKMLTLYTQPKKAADLNLTYRLQKGMVFLNELERAVEVLTQQCEYIDLHKTRILEDTEYRDGLNQTQFASSFDMLTQYTQMRDNCQRFINSANNRIQLLLKAMDQAQREHIRRNKKYIQLWVKRNWNFYVPDDIFSIIAEY